LVNVLVLNLLTVCKGFVSKNEKNAIVRFYTTWSVSQQDWRAVPGELSMELNNADVFQLGAS